MSSINIHKLYTSDSHKSVSRRLSKRHLIQLVFNNPLVVHIYKETHQNHPNLPTSHKNTYLLEFLASYGLGIYFYCCCLFVCFLKRLPGQVIYSLTATVN